MDSRVERTPMECLSLGGTPNIPEVPELSSLPKGANGLKELNGLNTPLSNEPARK